MPGREASGDFDYLFEDIPDEPSVDSPSDAQAAQSDDVWDTAEPGADRPFDAFDTDTWYFEPAPPPWYRTKRVQALLTAATVAAVALVVSGVLLAFRGPAPTAVDEPAPATQTAATTAPSRPPTRTSAPPPRPAPPPPATSAAPRAPAPPPAQTRQRAPSTRVTKEPEIGVTRTPATRSPISVAPQRPTGSPR